MIPTSHADLLDRISILRLKSRNITDRAKLANVRHELSQLEPIAADLLKVPGVEQLAIGLAEINQKLWTLEDAVRILADSGMLGQSFVDAARSIIHANDQRALLKRSINLLTNSALIEEKSHSEQDELIEVE